MESYATSEDNGESPAQESAAVPIDDEILISDDAKRSSESPEKPQQQQQQQQQKKMPTKLYVGNLSSAGTTGGKDLREMFQIYGEVSDVDVVGSFAFVVMPNEAEAEEAIKALHDKNVDGKMLIVEKKKQQRAAGAAPSRRKGERGRGHRDIQLFATRCKDISEEKLTEVFARFGSVVGVKKPRTKPDIAFVAMDHLFQARKAIESLDRKHNVEGLSQPIFVQLSTNNVGRDGRPLIDQLERGETVKLFVGNLDVETEAEELGVLFEKYGPVFDVAVIKGKGFGFVHMLSRESADAAVRGLDRTDFKKKNISVIYSVKKGMSIGRPGAMFTGDAGNSLGGGGRLGSKSMAPRPWMSRDVVGGGEASMRQQQHPRFLPDVYADGITSDPLASLQRQINSQFLSSARFNFDALLFPRDLPSRHQPYALSRDDRSRYGNFIGSGGAAAAAGNSPLKRGRSPPMRGVAGFSPSPKRNTGFFPQSSAPREDGQPQQPQPMVDSEFAMRRTAAQTLPPKIRGPQVTRVL